MRSTASNNTPAATISRFGPQPRSGRSLARWQRI